VKYLDQDETARLYIFHRDGEIIYAILFGALLQIPTDSEFLPPL
jgi:hypothetical protein